MYACFSQPLEVVCIDVVQTGTLQYVANLISRQVVKSGTARYPNGPLLRFAEIKLL